MRRVTRRLHPGSTVFLLLALAAAAPAPASAQSPECLAGRQESFAAQWEISADDWAKLCARAPAPEDALREGQGAFAARCSVQARPSVLAGLVRADDVAALCAQGVAGRSKIPQVPGQAASSGEAGDSAAQRRRASESVGDAAGRIGAALGGGDVAALYGERTAAPAVAGSGPPAGAPSDRRRLDRAPRTRYRVGQGEVDGVQVSVVSLAHARELFNEMAAQKDIPFAYPEDGCYARAHAMARRLEKEGIVTGKIFIENDEDMLRVETKNSPQGYVEWWYHVAPIVKVRVNGEEKIYVLDPSIFKEPVTSREWIAIQTKHHGPKAKRSEVYHKDRFHYTPEEKDLVMTGYARADLENMESTMRQYAKISQERQAQGGAQARQ